MSEQKKKTGRPPMNPEDRLAYCIAFRLRGGNKERLIAAAAENGRSISEEIEARVTASFMAPDIADRVAALLEERLAHPR